MQTRGLLFAVLLLAALAAGIWWSNKEAEKPSSTLGEAKSTKLMNLLEADLVEVKVTKKGEAPLVLKKDVTRPKWNLESEREKDPKFPTDTNSALGVVSSSSTFSSDKLVDENASDLIQYGLDPAQIVVEVKDKNGKTDKVLLGDETPVGSMVYARKADSRKVYAVANYLKTGVEKTAQDLRDKRLLLLDEAKVSRLELVRQGASIEFGRNSKNEWQVVKPEPMRADNLAVEELFRKAKEAKSEAPPAEEAKKAAATFASAPPLATLRVTDDAGIHQLELRKAKDNAYYAKSSEAAGVFKVADELGAGMGKSLEDFRNKKLLDFGFDEPVRIEIKNNGKTSILEKKAEDWTLGGQKMDPATVQPVIDQLRIMQGMKFAKNVFTAPVLEVIVTQKDGKSVEKLGVSKTGNFRYAKREGDATEYELDPKVISDLEGALAAIKPPGAAKK